MQTKDFKWLFPKNEGGRDSGFHDAGVETFKGNFDRYLARELIQNSLDARLDLNLPVQVDFQLMPMSKDDIPGIDNLRRTFHRCAEYWKNDEKAHSFFQHAETSAARRRITALKVSDYNTNGVPGTDKDRNQNWYHLVRCAGSSSKLGGEGGSFGIGKNAPFAASRLRTVFYSTKTPEGVAFQGVSTLVSHELSDGSIAQPIGFLGDKHGQSIRKSKDIPEAFRRTQNGLDIIALDYPAGDTWQNDLTYSVLDNFWPAIDAGHLVVTVGNATIEQSNLSQLLATFSSQEDFTAHLFHKAYKSPTLHLDQALPRLGESSLFLLAGDPDLPKTVAMVRKTGMVIYQRGHFRSLVPFCGVFVCANDAGNMLLREMEPPRHDKWDPDHPEPGANKTIEREYMSFIRESIRKLTPIDDSKTVSIPDLSRFLPDDEETIEDSFGTGDSTVKDETSVRSTLPEVIVGHKIDPRRRHMQADGDEETETEGEGATGTTGQGGSGSTTSKGGTDSGHTRHVEGDEGKQPASSGGVHSKPSIPLYYRCFTQAADNKTYTLVVGSQAKESRTVNLAISTVGDDQRAPADITSARLADGTPIPIISSGAIGPITLSETTRHKIEITLSEPRYVAMEVSAHET